MKFKIKQTARKTPGDQSLIKLLESPGIMISGI